MLGLLELLVNISTDLIEIASRVDISQLCLHDILDFVWFAKIYTVRMQVPETREAAKKVIFFSGQAAKRDH